MRRRRSFLGLATHSVLLAMLSLVSQVQAAQVCTTQTVGDEEFFGISGSSDSNVIGVGDKGIIYRFDGNTWQSMASPTNEDLNDVEVIDGSSAFAVGKDGTVLRLSGGSWTSIGGFTDEDLFGVWAASTSEVYVVGKDGTIFRYDGSAWSDAGIAAGTDNRDLEDAWGDANSFYALSERGELYRYDRGSESWDATDTTCNTGNGFEDLWGDAGGNLFLVRKKAVYRYNGSSCSVVFNTSEDMRGIHGSTSNGVTFAGGKKGVAAEFDGGSWQENAPASEDIFDVWVSEPGSAYYGGKKGEITTCEVIAPTVLADWRLDDCTLGFSGSNVLDSGPHGFDGVVVGGLAVQNTGQLCSAGDFNGTNSYVSVPDNNMLDVTDGFSVAVWVRHDGSPLKDWEAILAKGDSTYRLHLNGGCEIADSLPGNTRHGFTLGLNGGCGNADLNSNVVPAPNTWYHVAATYDRSMMRIYINGNLVNSANHSPPINTNNFDVFIGENSQQRGRYWSGDIDELTIWDSAISAADVVSHRDRTRPCTNCGGIEFVVVHDSFGINCQDESVRVDVVDSVAGTPRNDYNAQVTLDTQSGSGTWTLVNGGGNFVDAAANDGLAIYDWPLGESTAEFALSYPGGSATFDIDVYQGSDPSIQDDDSEGSMTFSPNGFTLTAAPLANPPPAIVSPFSATQTAGTDFPVYLAAYGQTPNDPQCGVIEAYSGPQQLKFWFDHVDPGTGSIAVSIDARPIPAAEALAANQAVTFVNGQAAVTAKYKDVGRLAIRVKDDSGAHPDLPNGIRGATAGFAVKPFRFLLSNIDDAGGNPNPAAADASGPVFVAAGEPFSVTVTALDAEGSATPNYGQESIAESVVLTPVLVAPATGDNPPIASGFAAFAGGQATGTNFSWPEVGIIALLPSVADGDYLGGGDVSGTASGNVGRFSAHHFSAVLNVPTLATGCTAGSYTYIGEAFGYSHAPQVTFTARALAGEITENYAGAFFKVDNVSVAGATYTALPATLDTSGLPPAAADPVIADLGGGTGSLVFSSGSGFRFARAAEEAPFDADIRLSVLLVDGDGATEPGNPLTFGDPGGMIFDSGATLRFGRARFVNAYGSELVDLGLPLRTEYFVDSATGFVPNIDDACTSNVKITFGAFTKNLDAGETCVYDTGAPGMSGAGCPAAGHPALRFRVPPLGGDFNLQLSAPGSGNDGSTTATADVPSWLEYDWDASSPGNEDPEGTAVFGIYEGQDRRIYIRELY